MEASERLIPLTTLGIAVNVTAPIVAKCSLNPIEDISKRHDYVLVSDAVTGGPQDYSGYAAVMTSSSPDQVHLESIEDMPIIHSAKWINLVITGDIVVINPSGFVRTVYRVKSKNNVIFATERCNSHCVMCSQPPKKVDDSRFVSEILKMIELVEDPKLPFIGISGGEPTLLKDDLFRIMRALKTHLPDTHVNMLTNGRMFCYNDFAEAYASVRHPSFCAAIPLYSDIPEAHDHVVQADGAFVQTMRGIYNLGELGQPVEIRVVLHALTYKRLPRLAEYIYRNIPFVSHVALMGLENMGYAIKNMGSLWIDPVEYQDQLFEAVRLLNVQGIHVSIYNHQLCVLKRELWPFARKSISDFKNIYLDECNSCAALNLCGGLFKSCETVHSKHIRAISEEEMTAVKSQHECKAVV